MGVTSEMSTPEPGYHGFRPASAATIAQILGGNGYSTAAFGKWHQTPPVEVSPSGPVHRDGRPARASTTSTGSWARR